MLLCAIAVARPLVHHRAGRVVALSTSSADAVPAIAESLAVNGKVGKLWHLVILDPLAGRLSKTKPVELLRAAYDAGQRDFGENTCSHLSAGDA